MKKFVALLLSMVLICLCITSAMAVGFKGTGSPTSFTRWSETTQASGSTWYLSWSRCNLKDGLKAAIKIYSAPGVYASHTFYYSTSSLTSHAYLESVTDGTNVYVAGKKYAGSGDLNLEGTFHP